MTAYRQDQHLPFYQGQGGAQPGNMRLVASYGFDRGQGIGPSFAPNSQLLPDGWAQWDQSDVLGEVPWVDAARREGVILVNPVSDPAVSPYALAGFIRRLPDAVIALPEFWIYGECGSYYQHTPPGSSTDNNVLSLCGLAVFEDNAAVLPAGDGNPVTAGVTVQGGDDNVLGVALADAWASHRALSVTIVQMGYAITGRVWCRLRVRQGIGITPGFSFDGGEHWIDANEKPSGDVRWTGFVGSAGASVLTPENDVPCYLSCSALSIFAPPTPFITNQQLSAQGSERVL
jgi:hypothetical protein